MPLHKVTTLSHLRPGAALRVTVDAREIGVFNVAGQVLAVKNLCPHYGDALHKGKVTDQNCVVCPGHGWHFDLATGACTSGNTQARLRTHKVFVKDGEIFIEV